MPALLKAMSIRPNLSTVKSTIRFTSASFATSARTNAASPSSFLISATTCAPSFSRRPVRTTLAAARANSIAVVLPIPDVPPVTSATLPENFFVFIQFPFAVVEFPKCVPPRPLLPVSPAQPSDVEFSSSNCGSVNCLDRAALRVTAACPAKDSRSHLAGCRSDTLPPHRASSDRKFRRLDRCNNRVRCALFGQLGPWWYQPPAHHQRARCYRPAERQSSN